MHDIHVEIMLRDHFLSVFIQQLSTDNSGPFSIKTVNRNDSSSSSFLVCNSRLRSAIRRHHPPQRAVLSQICCFGERKVLLFQILLDGAEPHDAGRGRPSCLLQSAGGEANRILLASALSTMHIICPNRVSRHDWIIAVSLGCFVSLRND